MATRPGPSRPVIHRAARHRGHRGMPVFAVGAAVALVTVGLVSATWLGGDEPAAGRESAAGTCAEAPLRVLAAPEIAIPVRSVAAGLPGCPQIRVSAADPAATAARLHAGRVAADVWIPDSSVWTADGEDGGAAPILGSVARSPVVLAVPATITDTLDAETYEGIARAATTSHPVVLSTGPASKSAKAQAVLADLLASLGSSAEHRGDLVALLRGIDTDARSARLTLPAVGWAARATTEQAVWSANTTAGNGAYRAVYPPGTGFAMDYPYVLLGKVNAERTEALFEALTGGVGAERLQATGFRSPRTGPGPGLADTSGIDTAAGTAARPLLPGQQQEGLRGLAVLDRPSRLLALIDVSGSMAEPVREGSSLTRIGLVRTAVTSTLRLFPTDTVAGLWRFSADLTPTTDYVQVTPMRRLTPQARHDLGRAVRRLHAVQGGGTGLYASVLAAVRHVREDYDPTRVNSVVVLSDGRNQDAGRDDISLETLLAALNRENDPRRPVVVISIAYGPDSDSAALGAISAVTGGSLYTATDPRTLPLIFRNAIGNRLCSTAC